MIWQIKKIDVVVACRSCFFVIFYLQSCAKLNFSLDIGHNANLNFGDFKTLLNKTTFKDLIVLIQKL